MPKKLISHSVKDSKDVAHSVFATSATVFCFFVFFYTFVFEKGLQNFLKEQTVGRDVNSEFVGDDVEP